ncbi:FG-GAP repeat protein [Streptomyces sp. NPDC093094]|uniref:FG-GAP repeat protein n=1 Tax=Streptomyces sp. NPDC093094 TaxID=3366026 RepID=UPI00381A2054
MTARSAATFRPCRTSPLHQAGRRAGETRGVPGRSEPRDCFGSTVSAGDVTRDGRPELFVGAVCEKRNNGAVFVLPGGRSRPTGTGSRVFTPDQFGFHQEYGTYLGGHGLLWIIGS